MIAHSAGSAGKVGMARPLGLDNLAADANGKRGDSEWVPITQAERSESLGCQLPEAARIPARQLLLLRAQQCSVCDAERKNESFRDWHLGRAVQCMILPRFRRTTHDHTRAAPNAPRSSGRLHLPQRYTYI